MERVEWSFCQYLAIELVGTVNIKMRSDGSRAKLTDIQSSHFFFNFHLNSQKFQWATHAKKI